jgi:hypothetical protein
MIWRFSTIGGIDAMITSEPIDLEVGELSLISIFIEGALGQVGVFYAFKQEECPPNWILS